MERCRITFEVQRSDKENIEAVIKDEYPKMKTVSDVIRAALREFLSKKSTCREIAINAA